MASVGVIIESGWFDGEMHQDLLVRVEITDELGVVLEPRQEGVEGLVRLSREEWELVKQVVDGELVRMEREHEGGDSADDCDGIDGE